MLTYRPVLGLLTVSCSLLSLAVTAQAQVTIGTNFTGNTLADVQSLTSSTIAPPDTDGSVGNNHYVQFTNGTFAIYNKSNGTLATPKISDQTFWQNAGLTPNGLSDTRIIFDPRSQRWFAAEITTSATGNSVFIARSNTADPTQGFKGASYVGNTGFADFPTLGVNADGVFIGTNNFTSDIGSFKSVSITSIPKADLLLTTPTVANRTTKEDATVGLGFTLQGATDFGPSNGHGSIVAVNGNFFGQLNKTNITGVTGSGASFGSTTVINVASTNQPGSGQQPDGTQQLDNGDYRISGNVYKVGNLLYSVRSLTVGSTNAIRWSVLDDTTNTLAQEGTLSDPLFDYSYPSIAVNANGQAVIGFSRSGGAGTGSAGDISSFAAASTSTGGSLNFGSPFLLKAGESTGYHLFGGSGERWGDFSATSADPTDPTSFWTTQEYAGPGANSWKTQVTQIRIGSLSTPEPGVPALCIGLVCALSAARRRSKRRTV